MSANNDQQTYYNKAFEDEGINNRNNEVAVSVGDYDHDPAEPEGCCGRSVYKVHTGLNNTYRKNKKNLWMLFLAVLFLLYAAYFGYALYFRFDNEGAFRLLWITCVVVFCLLIKVIMETCGPYIAKCCKPCANKADNSGNFLSWLVVTILFLAIIIFILVDILYITNTPYNLVSGVGLLAFILLTYLTSTHPGHVRWRPVVWGTCLQFIFALIILRWSWGNKAFIWLGDRVSEFLAYSDVGAKFLFGDDYLHHFFAFQVLPVVVFFSSVISILYYWGVMQFIICKVAIFMQFFMGTTAAESMNAAGNIFIGMSEAPLLIKPLLPLMTRSEIHAVMTGGFATIAGTVLAAYILFGAPANHLLSASVMSAPAALAIAKLSVPETEESQTTAKDVMKMEESKDLNWLDAASNGAIISVKLVAYIAVNLISFIALLAFVDATLAWFGERVGLGPLYDQPTLSFQLICSYVFFPVSLLMGVDLSDCRVVAGLIGIKTFLNEFVAFSELGMYISNRKNLTACLAINGTTYEFIKDDIHVFLPNDTSYILPKGVLTDRTEVIATYALCGFSNFGSIGIFIGSLIALAPSQREAISSVSMRSMIMGNVACFMTACIAGLLYQPDN